MGKIKVIKFQFIGELSGTAVPRFLYLTAFPTEGIINRVAATQSRGIFNFWRKFLWSEKKDG